jgi:hypothetical protein
MQQQTLFRDRLLQLLPYYYHHFDHMLFRHSISSIQKTNITELLLHELPLILKETLM